MLTELRISNLGVIADATIEPSAGMTAITGETGAGKTMLVSSLGLLLGERADSSVIRRGSGRTLVEGRFNDVDQVAKILDELGAETEADELLVARQVSKQGRSRAFVGGVQTPISRLAEVTGELATIHGQSEQIRLGNPDRQREVLDHAGGPELSRVLDQYRQAYRQRDELRAERDDLVHHAQERAREADLLQFGLDEISGVDPHPGEDAELAAEASRLQAVDDLRMLAVRASHALSGSDEGDLDDPGAVGLVGVARNELADIARLDEQASDLATTARALAGQVNELAADVASYLADLDADPLRLETLTSRRAALAGLTRKYGSTIDDVLDWAQQAATRLSGLGQGDQRVSELDSLLAELDARLLDLGGQITERREQAASRLASAVQEELAALAMPHARLRFELQPLGRPGPHGMEHVQLLFAANPGAEPGPLAKVASGGELSRVRLGLEVVLAADDPGHVFVFDEVDAGIGGTVAIEVGRRLARLAEYSQVICVTHLAQVAAFASAHWVVSKSSDGEVTTSDLSLVTSQDREAELARMMGGLDDSKSGLAHARDLLRQAQS
ncbi:DNA repair protein RecN [Propionimicrobium sp. PCR01-08-3]|uniref:DNA repair protein RecN n=1 Tax=Propionimicrobium sp. PCR01-08-3 TaxID=3052086 RepID=UPI00255C2859|nr:DNA repair protein RecN [Propionimicrobium sp. PCR01-08-3]WIY81833.1 DNA repair protein RecN [Propionimicrobium sp. PCR01-08-3]